MRPEADHMRETDAGAICLPFRNPRSALRAGFTLTELIIAMGIIVLLAALAAGLIPVLRDQQRAAKGADLLQMWLLTSKMEAQLGRTPAGLRLIADGTDPNFVFELQYIRLPDDYSKGQYVISAGPVSTFRGAEFDGGGVGLGDPDLAPVQPGDHLELYGGGPVTQITQVIDANTIRHAASLPPDLSPTSNYRILRQPRRLQGSTPLTMPKDIGIDLSRSVNVPIRTVNTPSGPVSFLEVLFAPAGGVVGRGTGSDKIILWVRDRTVDHPNGSPTLIVIYTRTGLIAAHPVDVSGSDPYSFAKNPRSSGL